MAARARAINPAIDIDAIEEFLTPANLAALLDRGYDVVLDCCDAFRVKVEMIAWCRRRKIPLLVSGSAGGRTDPTLIAVRDLSKTEHDAMLALIRKKLREDFNFPRGPKRYFGVQAVYSLENVKYPQADGSVCGTRPAVSGEAGLKLDCGGGLGAATHVTAAFAFAMVSRAIKRLACGAARAGFEARTGAPRSPSSPPRPIRAIRRATPRRNRALRPDTPARCAGRDGRTAADPANRFRAAAIRSASSRRSRAGAARARR